MVAEQHALAAEQVSFTYSSFLSFRLASSPVQAVPDAAFITGEPGRSPHSF